MSILPVTIFFSLSLAVITVSCSSPTSAVKPIEISQTGKSQQTVQIIIKFRNNSDPSKSDFVKELSRDAHAPLFYIRPMSGGAHVFGITGATESTAEILRRLRTRHDIEYVEQDSIMQPAVN
jgi:hypothetical protein